MTMMNQVRGLAGTLGILSALTLLATDARAADKVLRFTGDTAKTLTSGSDGKWSLYLACPQDTPSALTGIEFGERADEPNFVKINCRRIGSWVSSMPNEGWKKLGGGGDEPTQTRAANLGFELYVTRVQVWTNSASESAKRKIKGLKVSGRKINPDTGKTGPDIDSEDFMLPNASLPGDARTCPTDHVAVGVRVEYGSNGASGISLTCRKMMAMLSRPDDK